VNLNLAACSPADAGLFFGPDGEPDWARRLREKRAKAICAPCPLRAECLEYALAEGFRHGVFGGVEMSSMNKRIAARARGARARAAVEAAGEKHCGGCGRDLPLPAFARNRDSYQSRCRDCRSAYYQQSKAAA
jgi:WhiB family redox-sensing transcriptional regulator